MSYFPKPFSGHYEPKSNAVLHSDLNALVEFVENELAAVSRAMQETTVLELRETNKEPVRPKDGVIVLADGTNWDPGLGAGLYVRANDTWNLLTMTAV